MILESKPMYNINGTSFFSIFEIVFTSGPPSMAFAYPWDSKMQDSPEVTNIQCYMFRVCFNIC